MKTKNEIRDTLAVEGTEISVLSHGDDSDYISLTDLARHKTDNPKSAISNWMRLKDTIELLGIWEQTNNPDFKGLEFESFKKEAGKNAFTMTPTKWIAATNAIGIKTKRGRDGVRGQYVDDSGGIGSHRAGVGGLPSAPLTQERWLQTCNGNGNHLVGITPIG